MKIELEIIDSRLSELIDALTVYRKSVDDVPTLAKLKCLELYGAMVREQLGLTSYCSKCNIIDDVELPEVGFTNLFNKLFDE